MDINMHSHPQSPCHSMISACQWGKRLYPCVFHSQDCGFTGGKAGFKNCAELKEDALRHLNAYQCTNCGKCFGKKYGLARHVNNNKNPCTKRRFIPVFPEPARGLLRDLEGAKGYTEIQAVANRCAPFRDPEVESERKRQQQARRDKRTRRSNYNQLQEQTKVDPTLLNINYDTACTSPVDSVAISGNGNCSVGLPMVKDNPQESYRDPRHSHTTTPLSYRLPDKVNDEHESSCWGFSGISDMLGARENIVPISGLLARGTTQAHYIAPRSLRNNNVYPGPTYPSENVNTHVTFPPTMASSTPDTTPPTIATTAYTQPENYTAQHNSEYAASDRFAQPFIFVEDTQTAEHDLPVFTRPYREHQPGDPSASAAGQIQVALAETIGLGLPQRLEPTLFPRLESKTSQYNKEDTTSCFNTLPGLFDEEDNTLPWWFHEELDNTLMDFGSTGDMLSENFIKLDRI